jgi:hypothetical protein
VIVTQVQSNINGNFEVKKQERKFIIISATLITFPEVIHMYIGIYTYI